MKFLAQIWPLESLKGYPSLTGWRRNFVVFFLALVASASLVRGESIPDTTNRLVMAKDVERSYVNTLGLEGQSAAAAVQTMLAEGFRCRIEVAEEFVPEQSSMWYCVKRASGNPPPCDELRVSLYFAPPANIDKSRDALLANLGTIKVASASAFCPPSRFVGPAYLAARDTAEKSLASAIDALELKSTGEAAYGKLLRDGFYCGFVMPGKNAGTPQMECTKLPSSIEFCFEAKVTLDMTWPEGVANPKQFYKALPSSRVTSLRTSCEIPAIGPGRSAPV